MILVLAGTQDGRELAADLAAAGFDLLVSTATPYGAALLRSAVPNLAVREGRLDRDVLEQLLQMGQVQGLLDATHPFATAVSRLARETAQRCGVPYLRWERPPVDLPESPLVHRVTNWAEAAKRLASLGVRRIFLAVGVKPLDSIINHPVLDGCRFTVRVLPVPGSLEICRQLGLGLGQIIAYQGPGTAKLNEALLEACNAEAFLIKDSGRQGGTAEKAQAALNLQIPVVVVERPALNEDEPGPPSGTGRAPFWAARQADEVLNWANSLASNSGSPGSSLIRGAQILDGKV